MPTISQLIIAMENKFLPEENVNNKFNNKPLGGIVMKNTASILIIIFIFCSCKAQVRNNVSNSKMLSLSESIIDTNVLIIKNTSSEILKEWTNYYKMLDSNFLLNNFRFEYSDTLIFSEGNVFGVYDEAYNNLYNNFIVYSPNQNKYIDFDSYQWFLDKNHTAIFSPDQEVNLIDVNAKTVFRIEFYGTLNWVENGFWDNDTTIILLENSSENLLRLTVIDLMKRNKKIYKYKNSLNVKSNYSQERLRNKGVKYIDK